MIPATGPKIVAELKRNVVGVAQIISRNSGGMSRKGRMVPLPALSQINLEKRITSARPTVTASMPPLNENHLRACSNVYHRFGSG
jgi:hypothetical protein